MRSSVPASPDIRERLRAATREAHERLHGHEGFALVASGEIGLTLYGSLLRRLWGFHSAFEARMAEAARAFGIAPDLARRARTAMLARDLAALGLDGQAIADLPTCADIARPAGGGEALGALYVVEGSTLGGLRLARALQPLMAAQGLEARRFFLGYGEAHGAMWRGFLGQLEARASGPGEAGAILRGAARAFNDFELWMTDWRPKA